MTKRTTYILAGSAAFVVLAGVGAFFAASAIARRFEPALREQAIKYMQERFHSEVEIGSLHINRPRMSTGQILLRHGRIFADGPKSELFTRERLSELFGIRVDMAQRDGYYHLW